MSNRRNFLKGCLAASGAAVQQLLSRPRPRARDAATAARGSGLLYDATLCVGCKACVAACKQANDNPAEFSTVDQLWDTPLDTSGNTFNLIKMYRNGTMETKDFRRERLRLHEDLVHALRRPFLRFGLPGVGDDQGPGDRHRRLQRRCLHRLPLLRCRLPVRHSEVPVRLADRQDRQVRAVPASPQGRPLFGLRRGLPDRRHALSAAPRTCWPKPSAAGAEAGRVDAMPARPPAPCPGKAARQGSAGQRTAGATSYELPGAVGNYLQHVYGEKEYGGTQVLKLSAVNFQKVGMPEPAAGILGCRTSETIQHTLYGGLVMPLAVLGAMTWVAKRNVKQDDDEWR
jgi:ferredoxin